MALRNAKLARLAAGAAIIGTAGLTTAVAVADNSPSGSYGSADSGYGHAEGHRLHCPSYEGMVHSKGHAKCHYAPPHKQNVQAGDTDRDDAAAQQQAGTMDFDGKDSTTSTTVSTDVKGTELTRQKADDKPATTTTTEDSKPAATQPQATDPQATTDQRNCDHDRTQATTSTRDGDHTYDRSGDQTPDRTTSDRTTSYDGSYSGSHHDGRHRD